MEVVGKKEEKRNGNFIYFAVIAVLLFAIGVLLMMKGPGPLASTTTVPTTQPTTSVATTLVTTIPMVVPQVTNVNLLVSSAKMNSNGGGIYGNTTWTLASGFEQVVVPVIANVSGSAGTVVTFSSSTPTGHFVGGNTCIVGVGGSCQVSYYMPSSPKVFTISATVGNSMKYTTINVQ